MRSFSKASMILFFAVALAAAFQIVAPNVQAQSSYFTDRGCIDCHGAPTAATCAGCHQHSGTLTATKNKTTAYAPGETVTITLTASGARSGWIGVRLYNQTGAEIARSTGNQSGMGGSATYPAVLSAPAPATAGAYTWKISYFGNNNGTGAGDVHTEKSVNVALTVASAGDTVAPVVTFTLPPTATSLTVPATFTATDTVGVTGYLVNKSATPPAASATGWTTAAPTSVTAVAGSNTFYAWAKDAAGNVSAVKSATVVVTIAVVDTVAPVVTFTLPPTATSLTVPATFTATDTVGVTGYLVNKSATPPAASATGWTTAAPTSVTAVAGSNTFYAWAKDAAGNVSAVKSATVVVTIAVVDTVAPVVTFTLPPTATSLTVSASFTATDTVGVTGYLVNKSATPPAASATGWTTAAPTSVTAVAGSNTFYAWAKDAAGNVSAVKSATVVVTIAVVDTVAPVVTFTLPATATSLTVPATFTATDTVGVTGYLVNKSATPPAASATGWTTAAPTSVTAVAGSNTFYAWAKDAAGNVSAVKGATVVVTIATTDTTPPTLTVSTLANNSSTNKVTLNVSGSASDAGGLKSVTVNGQTVVVNAGGSFSTALTLVAGANAITVVAADQAGNQTTNSRTVTYDPTAPVLTVSAPADNSTTVQSFITVSGTVSENSTVTVGINGGSAQPAAITGTGFTATVNLVSGINTIDITATDLAGNTTSAKRTVTYSAPASQLTLAVTNPAQDVTTRKNSLTIRGTVKDASGAVKVVIKVNDHSYNSQVSSAGNFSRNVSFSRAGSYVIIVTATDLSGNTATVTRNVIYRSNNHDDDDHDDD